MLMVGAVLVISLLGSTSEAFSPTGVAAALAGSTAAWLVITPLLYAPLMMLEQGMCAELALAESARLTLDTMRNSSRPTFAPPRVTVTVAKTPFSASG